MARFAPAGALVVQGRFQIACQFQRFAHRPAGHREMPHLPGPSRLTLTIEVQFGFWLRQKLRPIGFSQKAIAVPRPGISQYIHHHRCGRGHFGRAERKTGDSSYLLFKL